MGINAAEEIPTLNSLPLYLVKRNKRETQKRLEEAGHHFKGRSDTLSGNFTYTVCMENCSIMSLSKLPTLP